VKHPTEDLNLEWVTPGTQVNRILLDMEAETFAEGAIDSWALVPFMEHGRVCLVLDDGEPVAHAILMEAWRSDPPKAYLFSLGVRPPYRGRGIASWLMSRLVETLTEEGFRRLELTVHPAHTTALHLYRNRFGFEDVRFEKDWYGPGEDRILMMRDLWVFPT